MLPGTLCYVERGIRKSEWMLIEIIQNGGNFSGPSLDARFTGRPNAALVKPQSTNNVRDVVVCYSPEKLALPYQSRDIIAIRDALAAGSKTMNVKQNEDQ